MTGATARRALRGGLAVTGVAALALLGPLASPAAADADDHVTMLDERITLDTDGTAHVTLDLTFDFGPSENHGPYLTYDVKDRYDDTRDRVLRFTDVRASSATAPAAVATEVEDDELVIRIGDEDETVTGEHTYRITYDVVGLVNPADFPFPDGELDHDELYLDVVGGWDVPIDRATMSVTGPADVLKVTCFAGPRGSTDSCDMAEAAGPEARYAASALDPGSSGRSQGDLWSVVAAWPAGTFDTEPLLQERWSLGRAFAVTPWTGGGAVLLAAVGAGLVVTRVRRTGRDREYLGLTPGLTPVGGAADHPTGPRRTAPIAVQFTPPTGVHPGQLGTLVDERADVRDVTATIIDLAVRGYLVIQRVADPSDATGTAGAGDWRLVRTDKDDAGLLGYEERLLTAIFEGRDDVLLSDLRTTFSTTLSRVQEQLYEDVTERGWFTGNPESVRGRWVGAGIGLTVLGIALTVLLATRTHLALLGLPLVAVGILVVAMAGSAPARTATGTAVLVQTEGFRRYLATAEADQLRFEEGEDLFSRYLPFAVAFGLTGRWTRVFAELAARGVDVPVPSWYLGAWGWHGFWASAGAFEHDLASFTQEADTAISAPSPSTSGSSGFSSGGGFSGGGIGGGGGGSW